MSKPQQQQQKSRSAIKPLTKAKDRTPKQPCPLRPTDAKLTKREQLMSKFKNIDFGKGSSELEFTVQTLEFPDANVKRTDIDKRDECGKSLATKKTAVDLTSSSNSHFRDGVFTVKYRKKSCTSTPVMATDALIQSSYRNVKREREPNSQEMLDSQHVRSQRHMNFFGAEWKKPCSASFDAEVAYKRVGACPVNLEELAKMSKTRQKFFLTQDPRKTHCLLNPDMLRKRNISREKEYQLVTKMVKHADNICAETESEASASVICEVIDLENPLNLDFQGMDYKTAYEEDERDLQNQMTYWRVLRYMDRKRTKAKTAAVVEEQLLRERLAVPPEFDTTIKDEPPKMEPYIETPRLAKLYRSRDKPVNKAIIEEERTRRQMRYQDIFLRNKERALERDLERKKQEAEDKEKFAQTVAENDFLQATNQIDDAIERSFKKIEEIKVEKRKRRAFPKTLPHTNRFKKKMLKENCIRRDAARVKKEFFLERTGKEKIYPDAELDINCEGSVNDDIGTTPTELSSDDEDNIEVGKRGSRFMLRGFHFKHGENLRGKLHRHQLLEGRGTVKGCLTREQWLDELAPRKEIVKLDVETGIQKIRNPDDPDLVLFPRLPIIKHHAVHQSGVRQYIEKKLGLQYQRRIRKDIKLVKPKLKYSVKKFNLIKHVFPDPVGTNVDELYLQQEIYIDTTQEYLEAKRAKEREERTAQKLKRMELLGLPCVEIKKNVEREECEENYVEYSEDHDWVPEPEDPYEGDEELLKNYYNRQTAGENVVNRLTGGKELTIRERLETGNDIREQPTKNKEEMVSPVRKRLTAKDKRRTFREHLENGKDFGQQQKSGELKYMPKRDRQTYGNERNKRERKDYRDSVKSKVISGPIRERLTGGKEPTISDRLASGKVLQKQQTDIEDIPNRTSQSEDGGRSELSEDESNRYRQKAGAADSVHVGKLPMRMRGNMPAPDFREKTLSIHPRKPRDYQNLRVPSQLFNEAVESTGVPILEKIEPDKIEFSNVRMEKRPYTAMLAARHHHDHWKPTQNKNVHVHYRTKVVTPQVAKVAEKRKGKIHNFRYADPPCKHHIHRDLTMPTYDFETMIKEHIATTKPDAKAGPTDQVKDLCVPFDFYYHSRDPEDIANLNFPGHKEYLDFLHATREVLYAAQDVDEGEEHLHVDKKAMLADLEEDLKSIENCLTSLSSSQCTNLSNDSGSFLLIEGQAKLPLDYIRKPLVPFEELNRSRFRAEVIDVDAEEKNPYKLLPFSGQLREQMQLLQAKDSFFTFNTRLRNSLRVRLEVPVTDVRTTLMGPGKNKFYGAVITDLDENYIDELKTRSVIKTFNFKTGIELLKDAMRLKFESLLIQGQIVRTKIYDRLNDQHWENMKMTKELYERLFAKWEKNEYEAAMSVVYQVKSYYETTDILKREYRDLERELIMLNMDIVFIEGHWIRCIMLQNFHYLLADQEWREANDWIHKVPKKKRGSEEDLEEECEEEDIEYELEPFDESIAKRAIVNIRERDKDDAWAIRNFYYDVYLQNVHPILQPYPDANSFLQGIENLKNKTFVLLLELHYTLSIHTELQGRLETFMDWCAKDLKEKQEYVARKSAKKYFMEARAKDMEQRVLQCLDQPIEESFNDAEFNKVRAVIAEVWRRIVPATVRGSSDIVPIAADMIAMISDTVMEILAKFEQMDIVKVREVEASLRKRRRYLEKLSFQAYQVERRIDMEMKKVRRNLEPPYKAPKRTGPWPRLYLKKKEAKKEVEEKVISEHTKFFIRAFHEDDSPGDVSEARESLMVIDTMQEQIVPFYFDHFLKLNGYTPNYNFKTQVELRDGAEVDRFRVRDIIPEVLDRLEQWEVNKRKIMEDNIQRNPKMYENVS